MQFIGFKKISFAKIISLEKKKKIKIEKIRNSLSFICIGMDG